MFKVGDKVRISAKFDAAAYEREVGILIPVPNSGVIVEVEPESDYDTGRNHVRLEIPGHDTVDGIVHVIGSFNDEEIEKA